MFKDYLGVTVETGMPSLDHSLNSNICYFGGGGYDNSEQIAQEKARQAKLDRQEAQQKRRNEATRDTAAKRMFSKRGRSLLRNNAQGLVEGTSNNNTPSL